MFHRILVPIDGSDAARHALERAIALARDQGAALRIIHVVDIGPIYWAAPAGVDAAAVEQALLQAGQELVAAGADQARRAGVPVETAVRETDDRRISDVIVDEARQQGADLIVMGTHGRHGLARLFLGSVADGVVRSAPVPVMLVR